MKIDKKVQKIIRDNKERFERKESYQKNIIYYNRLLESGIIKKQEYSIPSVDSTGKIVHELSK